MNLVTIVDGKPVFSEEAKRIVEFNVLIKRVKSSINDSDGRFKALNVKELDFVYWMSYYESSFRKQYEGEELETEVKKAVGLSESWKPDESVYNAIHRFEQLQRTATMDLLEELNASLRSSARVVAKMRKKIEDMLANDDLDNMIIVGNKVVDPIERLSNAVVNLLSIGGTITKMLKELEQTEGKVKGEATIKKGKAQREINILSL